MSPCKLITHLTRSSIYGISMYTTQSGWESREALSFSQLNDLEQINKYPTYVPIRLDQTPNALDLFFTSNTQNYNISYPLLLAPLITLFFLYLLPFLHLLLFLLSVIYGTVTDFSIMISWLSYLTFLGRIITSIPETPVWLQVKLLTSWSCRWEIWSLLLLNIFLFLNLSLIMHAFWLFKLVIVHINLIYILAQISHIKLLFLLLIVARLFFIRLSIPLSRRNVITWRHLLQPMLSGL